MSFNHPDSVYQQIKFTETDVINLDDWIPAGEYNPHNVRPFLLHDHGFCLCVVFADCLQDAIDEAVDQGKLDRYMITDVDKADYLDPEIGDFRDDVAFLGNASEPFDIESLGAIELPNPPRSFCAQFNIL